MALFRAELKGRDLIEMDFPENSTEKVRIRVLGCTECLSLVRKFQMQFGADPKTWPLPIGATHSELLLKEVLLKSRDQWVFPFQEEEICHCRSVSTEMVDAAIVAGAHQAEVVSRHTSASTSCGTCRPDVQKIIQFRLKNPV